MDILNFEGYDNLDAFKEGIRKESNGEFMGTLDDVFQCLADCGSEEWMNHPQKQVIEALKRKISYRMG